MFLCFPDGFKVCIYSFKNHLTLIPEFLLFPVAFSLIVFFFFFFRNSYFGEFVNCYPLDS